MSDLPKVCADCNQPIPEGSKVCPRCSTLLADPGFPTIPGFRIVAHLGAGGMGSVYLGEDEQLERRVAIKLVAADLSKEPEARARFRREARAMATVEHPNVVRIYSFGEVGDTLFLVMEFVEGETLAERLRRFGPLPEADAVAILRAVVAALQVAWEKGIVHRDLKPANVLLDKKGIPRVADFGLAKAVRLAPESTLTGSGYLLGTPHYASPEQARGGPVDHRSDIYSLGIMLFEMVTGRRPFEGPTPFAVVDHHLHSALPDPRAFRPGLSEAICRLISRMTEKAPERRPQSYEEVLALASAVPSRLPTTVQVFARGSRSVARRALTVGAGIAAVAVLAVGLRLLATGRRPSTGTKPSPRSGLTIAVAPFYGPDEDSSKEGRVMSVLVERAINARLGLPGVKVLGVDVTGEPIRSQEAAQTLGQRTGAAIVVWGEVLTFKREVEVQPHLTVVAVAEAGGTQGASGQPFTGTSVGGIRHAAELAADSSGWVDAFGGRTVKLESEAANQIELHRTSATGIGDMVVVLAALNALATEHNPKKALELVQPLPETSDRLHVEAVAHLQAGHRDLAIAALRKATSVDPLAAQSFGLLGDILFEADDRPAALVAYQAAAATGRTYTTTRAVLRDGLLYFGEKYSSEYTGPDEIETLYLLGADPATREIRERYALPGIPRRFKNTPTGLEIVCVGGPPNEKYSSTIRLSEHHLDRPVLPGASLLLQIRSIRTGLWRASNFLGDLAGYPRKATARFACDGPAYTQVPATLKDLEAVLTEAARQDPTQPWHPFFLGLTQWELGDQTGAQASWTRVVSGSFPGTPYYEFAWMASYLENTGHPEWADKVHEVAFAKRSSLPVPPDVIDTLCQIIHFPPLRIAAIRAQALGNSERAYVWLQRARAMLGVNPDFEPVVSALWAKEFRSRNDWQRLEQETAIGRRMAGTALAPISTANLTDLAFYACTAATIVLFLTLLACLTGPPGRWTRAAPVGGEKVQEEARSHWFVPWFRSIHRPLRIATVALAGSAAAVALISFPVAIWANYQDMTAAIPIGLSAVFVGTLLAIAAVQITRRGLKGVIRSITRDRLLAVLVGATFALGAYTSLALLIQRLNAGSQIPMGLPESLADPRTRDWLEKRYREVGTPDAAFAVAVSNQLGGNWERAEALYRQLGSASAAQQNLSALLAGEARPKATVGTDAIFRLALPHGWREWGRALARPEVQFRHLGIGYDAVADALFNLLRAEFLACLTLAALWVAIGHTDPRSLGCNEVGVQRPQHPRGGFLARLAAIESHGTVRGTVTQLALLVGIIGLVGFAILSSHYTPAVGPISAEVLLHEPNIVPLPPRDCGKRERVECYYRDLLWSQPKARLVVSLLGVALIVGVALAIDGGRAGRKKRSAADKALP